MAFVNVNFFGNPGLIVESMGEVNTDLYGLETCAARYRVPADRYDLVPLLFSAHPLLNYLYMEKRRVEFIPGFLAITAEYAGIPGGSTVPIFELVWGTSEEPIESHPNFVSQIAGHPSSPLNGAIFLDERGNITTDDSRGVFDRFTSVVGGDKNPLAGVTSFLELSQMTFRKTVMTVARPSSLEDVGFIGDPEGPAPAGPNNWLYVGITYQQRGIIFSVQQEWRASGRNGWNELIYGRELV